MKFLETLDLKFDNIEFIDGEFVNKNDYDEKIQEGEGSFLEENLYMNFKHNKTELTVIFEQRVSGYVSYDSGDYYTPPCYDCEITNEDVYIQSFFVSDYEVRLNNNLKLRLEKLIKKHL